MNQKGLIILLTILLILPLVNARTYGTGRYSAGVYGVGEVEPTINEGVISREVVDCEYKWECTEWFPSICPEEGVQKRLCFNKGTCSGVKDKPSEIRTCTPESKQPLFDFFVRIPNKWISQGENLLAKLELVNVREIKKLDIFLKYWIVDINNALIFEKQETRAVEQGVEFDIEIELSKDIKPGLYRLYTQATYDVDNKVAMGEDSFEIIEKKSKVFINRFLYYFLFGIISWSIILYLIYKLKFKKKPKKEKIFQLPQEKITKKEHKINLKNQIRIFNNLLNSIKINIENNKLDLASKQYKTLISTYKLLVMKLHNKKRLVLYKSIEQVYNLLKYNIERKLKPKKKKATKRK